MGRKHSNRYQPSPQHSQTRQLENALRWEWKAWGNQNARPTRNTNPITSN